MASFTVTVRSGAPDCFGTAVYCIQNSAQFSHLIKITGHIQIPAIAPISTGFLGFSASHESPGLGVAGGGLRAIIIACLTIETSL